MEAAGGFALGMQLSLEKSFDWVWLHDDDGYPHIECLSLLLQQHNSSRPAILAPVVKDFNNTFIKGFPVRREKAWQLCDVVPHSPVTMIDATASAGLLIPCSILAKIGVYDYKHFFSCYEDWDYCYRARKAGFSIKLVSSAIYYHPNYFVKHHIERKPFKASYFPFFLGAIHTGHSIKETQRQKGYIYANIVNIPDRYFLYSLLWSLISLLSSLFFTTQYSVTETLRVYWKAFVLRHSTNLYARVTEYLLKEESNE